MSMFWTASNGLDVGDYYVSKVAIHLIDRTQDDPKLGTGEIDLSAYNTPNDEQAIRDFFQLHLAAICEAEENMRTRPASFVNGPDMQRYYEEIIVSPALFFDHSCAMAQLLHSLSKNRNASTGVLVIVLFRRKGVSQTCLALLKMDHERTNKIALRQGPTGEVLLDLAIHYIEASLPDSRERVLKWAIIPHPYSNNYDLLIRDHQGGQDPAAYFMMFVGCDPKPSEKLQARNLLRSLPRLIPDMVDEGDKKYVENRVIDELLELQTITTESLSNAVYQVTKLPDDHDANLEQELQTAKLQNLNIPSSALENITVEYRISGDVVIKGPLSKMREVLTIRDLDGGGVEYVISAPAQVEPRYV